jgi:hypothetical protein
VHIRSSYIYVCVCVCVCVFEVEDLLWDVEPRCIKVSVLIHVKRNHTQIINNIALLHVDLPDEKRWGWGKLDQKGKRGDLSPSGYFINIFKRYNLWIFNYPKFSRDGNESTSG